MYEYLKALHIIFIVTWFAGLFYIVRLFIYHAEANEKAEPEKSIIINQLTIMQKRLWYIITMPSAIITGILGPSLIQFYMPLSDHKWLITKIGFVTLLYFYHFKCANIMRRLQSGKHYSPQHLRLYNEGATLLLFSIVFLVVLKDLLKAWQGVTGLIGLSVILMIGIKLYRKYR